jgi:hypothetical protein
MAAICSVAKISNETLQEISIRIWKTLNVMQLKNQVKRNHKELDDEYNKF